MKISFCWPKLIKSHGFISFPQDSDVSSAVWKEKLWLCEKGKFVYTYLLTVFLLACRQYSIKVKLHIECEEPLDYWQNDFESFGLTLTLYIYELHCYEGSTLCRANRMLNINDLLFKLNALKSRKERTDKEVCILNLAATYSGYILPWNDLTPQPPSVKANRYWRQRPCDSADEWISHRIKEYQNCVETYVTLGEIKQFVIFQRSVFC